jgi:transcription-repair coupling factor (superfamily II helicase)
MAKWVDRWFESEPWKRWRQVGLTGLRGSSKAYVLSRWREKARRPLLIILPTSEKAEFLVEDLQFFQGEKKGSCLLFPQWETLPYDEIPPHPEIVRERVNCLFSLLRGEEIAIVSPIQALMQKVLSPADLRRSIFSLTVGREVDREDLTQFLREGGYTSSRVVEERRFQCQGGDHRYLLSHLRRASQAGVRWRSVGVHPPV